MSKLKLLIATGVIAATITSANATYLRDPDIKFYSNPYSKSHSGPDVKADAASHSNAHSKAHSNSHSKSHSAATNKSWNSADSHNANKNKNHNTINFSPTIKTGASKPSHNVNKNHAHNNAANHNTNKSHAHNNASNKVSANNKLHNNVSGGNANTNNRVKTNATGGDAHAHGGKASANNRVNAGSQNAIDASSHDTVNANSTNTNTFDASTHNDLASNAHNNAANDNSTTINGGDTNVVALDYDAIDLANLPVAVCQGSSVSASGSGNDGLFGIGLGFGKSNIDDQCTLRENIRAVATIAEYVPSLRVDMLSAIAHLDGFEHMWPTGQHPKCPKWIKKGSKKAIKHNCQFPGAMKPTAHMAPAPAPLPAANIDPQEFIVYFEFDKHSLTNQAKAVVRRASGYVAEYGAVEVIISGHTDTMGTNDYNEKLARKRAKRVQKELIANGVPAQIVEIESFGERQLAVPSGDNVPELMNRRAEFTIYISPRKLGA